MGWALDPRAVAIIGRSHGVSARVTASINGSQFVVSVPLLPGGSVAIDGKSPARRSLTCNLQAVFGSPAVDPIAAELRAEYAVVDAASGRTYWTPVGTFVVTETVETSPGVVSVKGVDRWQRVSDARFERPRTTSGSIVAAITALLTEADSRISVTVDPGLVDRTHTSSLWDKERGDAIKQLATSIGARVWFDPLGVAHISPIASLGDPVYWQIGRGPGGAKSSARRGVSRARTYNAVAVTGTPGGNTPPVYYVARDTDPTSPTRWGGPMGKRTLFYASSLISTTAQATTVAMSLLAGSLGVARTLALTTPPHPGLDADDVALVETDPGVWERHIVEAFTLPLGMGTSPIDTRSSAGAEES